MLDPTASQVPPDLLIVSFEDSRWGRMWVCKCGRGGVEFFRKAPPSGELQLERQCSSPWEQEDGTMG